MKCLIPLSDRLFIKKQKVEERDSSGLYLPGKEAIKHDTGEVVYAGPGKKDSNGNLIPMPVKVGDKVMWDKYSASDVSYNEENFVVVKADDIYAILC